MNLPNLKLIKERLSKLKLPDLKWPMRLLLYLLTLIISTLSIIIVCFSILNFMIANIIYVIAAGMLSLSSGYLYKDIRYGIHAKIKAGIEKNSYTNRLFHDYRYRTVSFTYSSLTINLLYAFINAGFGILNHSIWFGSLAAYYIILSMMRFRIVSYDRKILKLKKSQKTQKQELSIYQISGFLFIILTISLTASVIQMVYFDQKHTYPGTMIFAVALYTFYKITLAVINVIKVRKLNSPLLMTIRNIGYADAMVSLLSLQTAMLVSFGSKDSLSPQKINSVTGGTICLMILIMGIYMVISATKQKRLL